MELQTEIGDGYPVAFERAFVPFEIEMKDDEEPGTFEGMAAVFNNVDRQGDIIKPGAFKGSIRSPKKIKMLWQHDSWDPVGVWKEFEETDKGLRAKGALVLDVQRAAEAHALMKAGAVDGLSIGFMIPKNGSAFDEDNGIRTITKVELWEVSLVTFPANPKARLTSVKSAAEQIMTIREFERFLRDVGGYSIGAARAIASTGFDPELDRRDDAGEGLDRLSEALRRRGAAFSQ